MKLSTKIISNVVWSALVIASVSCGESPKQESTKNSEQQEMANPLKHTFVSNLESDLKAKGVADGKAKSISEGAHNQSSFRLAEAPSSEEGKVATDVAKGATAALRSEVFKDATDEELSKLATEISESIYRTFDDVNDAWTKEVLTEVSSSVFNTMVAELGSIDGLDEGFETAALSEMLEDVGNSISDFEIDEIEKMTEYEEVSQAAMETLASANGEIAEIQPRLDSLLSQARTWMVSSKVEEAVLQESLKGLSEDAMKSIQTADLAVADAQALVKEQFKIITADLEQTEEFVQGLTKSIVDMTQGWNDSDNSVTPETESIYKDILEQSDTYGVSVNDETDDSDDSDDSDATDITGAGSVIDVMDIDEESAE